MAAGPPFATAEYSRTMNLRQLEVFYAVMKTGSITGAAQMLCVTQPAVSTTLRLAEKRLGVVLFDRVKGRLLPTREALRLQADAVDIYSRMQTFGRLADEMREGRLSELVIATSPTLANTLLPAAITELRREHPHACISIHSAATRQAVDMVASREADVGVVYGPVDAPVDITSLGRSSLVCVMPRNHPLTALDEVRADDLKPYPLIAMGPGSPLAVQFGEALSPKNAGRPAILLEGSSWFTASLFVSRGAGVAIVDLPTARADPSLAWRPFTPASDIALLMVHPPSRQKNSMSNALERILRDLLSQAAEVPRQP